MKLARYGNVIAIQTDRGNLVGLHAHNLEVARLDQQAWDALQCPSPANAEAQAEILEWDHQENPQTRDADMPQQVRALTINIAQVCNLKCSYCAAGGDGSYGSNVKHVDIEKLKSQVKMLLADVPSGDRFKFMLLGGEPLVYPDAIKALYRHVNLLTAGRGIHIKYEMVTNATLVTPEIAELLAQMQCHVTVSLDGPPELNDHSRPTIGNKGATERTLRGVQNLMQVRGRLGALMVNAVFGQHNSDVMKSYLFLQAMPWDKIQLTYAVSAEDEIYSGAYLHGMKQVADWAWNHGGEDELRRITQFDQTFALLDGQTRIHNHCGAGKWLMQVDTAGKFYVCNWFVNQREEEVGRDLQIDAQKIEKYQKSLIEMHNCGSCWARHLCGGGCMFVHKSKTGNKHQKDPYFCERIRTLVAKGIEYYEQARTEERQCEAH